MVEALEERSIEEVVDHNLAIEALKKEIDTLEDEKAWLMGKVGGLNATRANLENLCKEVESLNKQVEDTKTAEQLASERSLKVVETADNLRKEVDAERESSMALKAQVNLLTQRLEDTKELGVAATELYAGTLEQFGGSTSVLPSEPSAFDIFSWMKATFVKLPDFIGSTVDFGALASAPNFSKMLAQDGCLHVNGVQERDLEGLSELGALSHDVRWSVRSFMKSF
jgi:hypothetical protein